MAKHARNVVADGLENAVRRAHETREMLSSALPIQRVEVLAAEPQLTGLAARLRGDDPVPDEIVGEISSLLSDSSSMLYRDGAPGALRCWALRILNELEQWHPTSDADG